MKISPEDQKLIEEICRRHDLLLVVLYGSRARNMSHKYSDTDIAVKSKKLMDRAAILELESEFDRIFRNSEIVDVRTAPVLLLANIASDGILIYEERECLFDEFRIFAINQYIEYKPYLHRQSQLLKEIIDTYE